MASSSAARPYMPASYIRGLLADQAPTAGGRTCRPPYAPSAQSYCSRYRSLKMACGEGGQQGRAVPPVRWSAAEPVRRDGEPDPQQATESSRTAKASGPQEPRAGAVMLRAVAVVRQANRHGTPDGSGGRACRLKRESAGAARAAAPPQAREERRPRERRGNRDALTTGPTPPAGGRREWSGGRNEPERNGEPERQGSGRAPLYRKTRPPREPPTASAAAEPPRAIAHGGETAATEPRAAADPRTGPRR